MQQLLLPSGITIHYILEPQAWLKNHRQLPTLPGAIRCTLLYCSLPLPVEVREPYRVIVSCRKDVAWGLWGVLVMELSRVLGLLVSRVWSGECLLTHTHVGIVTARQHMAEEE